MSKLRLKDFKVFEFKIVSIYTYEYDGDNTVEFYEDPIKHRHYIIAWHGKGIGTTSWESFKASDISEVVDYINEEVERVRW